MATLLLGWLYFSLQEYDHQQATIDKIALGLKVEGRDGQRISFGQATGCFLENSCPLLFYSLAIYDDSEC